MATPSSSTQAYSSRRIPTPSLARVASLPVLPSFQQRAPPVDNIYPSTRPSEEAEHLADTERPPTPPSPTSKPSPPPSLFLTLRPRSSSSPRSPPLPHPFLANRSLKPGQPSPLSPSRPHSIRSLNRPTRPYLSSPDGRTAFVPPSPSLDLSLSTPHPRRKTSLHDLPGRPAPPDLQRGYEAYIRIGIDSLSAARDEFERVERGASPQSAVSENEGTGTGVSSAGRERRDSLAGLVRREAGEMAVVKEEGRWSRMTRVGEEVGGRLRSLVGKKEREKEDQLVVVQEQSRKPPAREKRETLVIRMPEAASSTASGIGTTNGSTGRRSRHKRASAGNSTSSKRTLSIRVRQRPRRHHSRPSTADANLTDDDEPLSPRSFRRVPSPPPPLPSPPSSIHVPHRRSFQTHRAAQPSRFSSFSLPPTRFTHLTRTARRTLRPSHPETDDEATWPRIPMVADTDGRQLRNWELHPGANAFPFDGRCVTSLPSPIRTTFSRANDGGSSSSGRNGPRIPWAFVGALATQISFGVLYLATNATYLHEEGGGLIFLFSYAWLLSLASMLVTAFSDPGIVQRELDPCPPVRRKWVTEEGEVFEEGRKEEEGVEGVEVVEFKLVRVGRADGEGSCLIRCKWCQTWAPRTSHCRLCDNCVALEDHHCSWLSNCVGQRNYLSFFIFLASSTAGLVIALVLSCYRLKQLATTPRSAGFGAALAETPATFVVFILAAFLVIPVGYLFGYHCRLVCLNKTTIEQLRENGTKTSTGTLGVSHPFSHASFVRNIVFALCRPRGPSWIDWRGKASADGREESPREVGEKERGAN